MNSKIHILKSDLLDAFHNKRNEVDARKFKDYMKGHFEFYGVRSPERKSIQKLFKPVVNTLNNEELLCLADILWNENRELQYVAIDYLTWKKKLFNTEHLNRLEHLLTSKSWWDTVDLLASNIVGHILKNKDDIKLEWVNNWITHENMWLRRTAIIHQLKYKEKVELDLLFALITSEIESKEFFIQKACGWALRQASKVFPMEIKNFIDAHPNLSKLTVKEGSKYI